MFRYFSNEQLSERNGMSATITMQTWLFFFLLSLLNIIPIIGTIAWLVVYLVIGFSSETAPSLRNYIKLQIIVSVVCLLFFGIVCGFAFSLFEV